MIAPSRLASWVLLLAACGGPAATAHAPPPSPAVDVALSASTPSVPTSAAANAPPPPPPSASVPGTAPPLAEIDLGAFTHELGEPVWSIALGEKRVAALGDEAWLTSPKGLAKIALPNGQRPSGEGAARIFFGRDDLPRIMGARLENGVPTQLYLRYRNGRWSAEKNEVGRLLQAPARPLWGVLGHADPEVACKELDVCIVKRLSGWKTLPAGAGTPLVELQNGVAWALHPNHLEQLNDDVRWHEGFSGARFEAATGFCVVGNEAWVSEASVDRLHHFVDGGWTSTPSPARGPRGLWATSRSDVWLASETGLLHFDGQGWSRAKDVTGAVSEVRGRGSEIWAGGKSGVWASRSR